MIVKLSWREADHAVRVGSRRQLLALKNGQVDQYGFNGDPWEMHIQASGAEVATAKALDRYILDSMLGDADVGSQSHVEVRWRSKAKYQGQPASLILHEKDLDVPHVLVLGDLPTYDVVGWAMPSEVRLPDHWRDPAGGRPAFFVPQSALKPLEELT